MKNIINHPADLLDKTEDDFLTATISVCTNKQCENLGIQIYDSDGECLCCGLEMLEIFECAEEIEDDMKDRGRTFEGKSSFSKKTFGERISDRLYDNAVSHTHGHNHRELSRISERNDNLFTTGNSAFTSNSAFSAFKAINYNPPTTNNDSDVFTCNANITGSCPVAPKSKVFFPLRIYNMCVFLAQQISDEWFAYLKGHQDENNPNNVVITDIYFPAQTANGVHCEANENTIEPGTIAAIHSHNTMGAFFSEEDKRHMNHQIEMVINSKGEIKANGRIKLDCGRFQRDDADIKLTECDAELEAKDKLLSLITKDTGRGNYSMAKTSGAN